MSYRRFFGSTDVPDGHPLEIEGRVEPPQDIFLELAEGVGIIEWHGKDLEVDIRPGRQLRFVDGRLSASGGEDRSYPDGLHLQGRRGSHRRPRRRALGRS